MGTNTDNKLIPYFSFSLSLPPWIGTEDGDCLKEPVVFVFQGRRFIVNNRFDILLLVINVSSEDKIPSEKKSFFERIGGIEEKKEKKKKGLYLFSGVNF